VRDALAIAEPHRGRWLRALQRLDLALLVDAEDERLVRRVEVQPGDVARLVDEQRVGREAEALRAVRLDAEEGEVARHRALRDPGLSGW
jgi:hypothetical protein